MKEKKYNIGDKVIQINNLRVVLNNPENYKLRKFICEVVEIHFRVDSIHYRLNNSGLHEGKDLVLAADIKNALLEIIVGQMEWLLSEEVQEVSAL
jgi:hypothetical protein